MRTRVVLLATLAAVGACARPGSPPGGPGDRLPPVVAQVEPDTFAIIEPGDRTVRLRFNERISRRPVQGTLAAAVTVSPRTGEVKVSHNRMGLDIEVEGGLQPGLVYRVAVAPVLEDMFDNPMAVPFEWVFSTGDDVRPNAIVGQVWDATTGEPVEAAQIEVRRADAAAAPADTFPYVATTDSVGIFVVRYVPEGRLNVQAWQDLNGDGEVEMSEPIWQQELQIGATDTLTVSHLPILAGDTLAAQLLRAEVLDSLTLRLEFDDFLDPRVPIEEFGASLAPATDSLGEPLEAAVGATAPDVARLFHEAEFTVWADSLAEAVAEGEVESVDSAEVVAAEVPPVVEVQVPDSLAADSLAADSVAVPEVSDRPRTPDEFAVQEALDLLPNGLPVPQRTFVVRLATPLPRGVPFDVTVTGVINLAQRAGGGGEAPVELPAIEPEDPPPPAGSPAPSVGG